MYPSTYVALCQMNKTKDLRLRIEPELFDQFAQLAKALDMPVSQILRRLIAQFVEQNSAERQNTLFPLSSISVSHRNAGSDQ